MKVIGVVDTIKKEKPFIFGRSDPERFMKTEGYYNSYNWEFKFKIGILNNDGLLEIIRPILFDRNINFILGDIVEYDTETGRVEKLTNRKLCEEEIKQLHNIRCQYMKLRPRVPKDLTEAGEQLRIGGILAATNHIYFDYGDIKLNNNRRR